MKEWKGNLKKFILLLVASVICGCIVAASIGGYQYNKAGKNKGKQPIDINCINTKGSIEKTRGKYKVLEEGGKIFIKFPKQYINKLSFEYNSPLFSGFTIYVKKDNIYGVEETISIKDKFMKDMPRSVINVNGMVSEIEIVFDESQNLVEVWNFSIDNSFKINPLISIFVACVVFLTGFLLIFRKENAEKPSIAIFMSIMVISTCLLLLQPPYINGWDEQIHYKNAYMLGVLNSGEATTQTEDYIYGYPYYINTYSRDAQESVEEHLDIIRVFNEKARAQGTLSDDYNSLQMINVGYLFQAISLKVGNVLNFPFYIVWLMGKFSNVLLYAIVMSLAVHIVPVAKRVLMVIALLPTMIFQSTSYTYDVTVIAFVTLAICILLREFICRDAPFRYRWRVMFLLSMFAGCFPKAVYAPLILGALFLGRNKFYSKKDCIIFKWGIILGFIMLMATFILPVLISPSQVGDTRGGDTSEARQIQYVLGQPIAYAVVLIRNVLNSIEDCIIGRDVLCNFSYLGMGKLYSFCAVLLTGVTITDTYTEEKINKRVLPIKIKIAFIVQIAAVIALIWTALYLSFTEVGISNINGVQPRYYLPFLFLLYLCFQTEKIKTYFPLVKYQLFITLSSTLLVMQQIFQLVLLGKCL